MIELRWFHKKASIPVGVDENLRILYGDDTVRILQYRTMRQINPFDTGLAASHWSDWQDVPEVFDTTKEQV